MKTKEKGVYGFLLVLWAILWIFVSIFFLATMGTGPGTTEGDFITPGNAPVEWFLALNVFLLLSLLGTGILAYWFSTTFMKSYVKALAKKRKVGLIPFEDLTSMQLLKKLLIRCLILGFFISNIAYTLANQETIINLWRIAPPMGGRQLVPDPEVMYQLLWLTAIPCVLFLVPVWLMINAGIVSTKKLKGADFETVNLSVSPLYKIVKGYAGVGFVYNYLILILFWAVPSLKSSDQQIVTGAIMQLISPILIILFMAPIVILIEMQQMKYRKKVEETLGKLDLNQQIVNNIELKKV